MQHTYTSAQGSSLVLLCTNASMRIKNLDVQLQSSVNNFLALACGYPVCNLGCVTTVGHHQHLQFLTLGGKLSWSDHAHTQYPHLGVVDDEFEEAVREHAAGLLIVSIADVGHQIGALEPPTHTVINTLGLPPTRLRTDEGVYVYTYKHRVH